MRLVLAFILGLIALPLIFVLAGIGGLLPIKATSTPPQWEAGIAMRELDASLEKRAKGLKNPIRADDKTALAAGGKIYAGKCAVCHGDSKGPSKWGANDFYPRVPQFYQGGMEDLTPEEAYAAVHDGVRYSGMAAWSDRLTEQEIWQVANFAAAIKATKPMKH
jgi:mono/diheme cytochrome c family protein